MDRHEQQQLLPAFLAGDLDREAARAFDEHLLSCERCWAAVRADRFAREAAARLRETAPAQLADRVRLAVELSAGQRASHRHIARRPFIVGAGVVAAVIAALLTLLLPSRAPATPAPIAAVVQYARLLPSASPVPGSLADAPLRVTGPLSLSMNGTRITVRYYRFGAVEVAVATAERPFPEPGGVRLQPGAAMAWSASVNGVSLYCPSSRVLLAAPIPISQLVKLAALLPSG